LDCEGCEYDVFLNLDDAYSIKLKIFVMEYHRVHWMNCSNHFKKNMAFALQAVEKIIAVKVLLLF